MGIRFGALEDDQLTFGEETASGISLDALEAIPAISHDAHQQVSLEQASFLEQLEQRRAARTAAVPTGDLDVRRHLVLLSEPMTLFGEGPYERRERLKALMSAGDNKKRLEAILAELNVEQRPVVADADEFFVPGTDALVEARRWILAFSLPRSKARLEAERAFRSLPMAAVKESRLKACERLKTYTLTSSQVGCERPLSACAFSPDGVTLATGGFGGSLKLWSGQDASLIHTWEGHTNRTCSIAFHPFAGEAPLDLASASADCSIVLWSAKKTDALLKLVGHTARVSQIAFHPSGRLLASASFDTSWRLWDLTTGAELQLQEGHSRPVYCVAMHQDGALAATAGFDAIARLWDMRIGRAIWSMKGKHVKPILSLAFPPSGYEIATGSEDGTVVIWDMRVLKPTYQLPAHPAAVSSLKFTPDGTGLITASFDGTARTWARYGWQMLASLQAHQDSKIMAMDLTSNGAIVTASYDRTFKLWQS